MKKVIQGIPVGLLAVILVVLPGCDLWSRRVKAGSEFTLRPKEKVVVSGSGLGIRLMGVGHSWYVDRRADSVFATLEITGGGAPVSSSLDVGHTKTVGEYDITVESAEESRSEGGPKCELRVTRRR